MQRDNPTFKGYNKIATSNKTMRIIKRERILSFIVGEALLVKLSPEVASQRLANTKKKHNFDWQINNLAELTISEHASNKDYFDWKVDMIKQTQWLSNLRIWEEGNIYHARWHDTRKLRIYYKWMHRSGRKTYERVLKYMYSNLFPAILVMDRGAMNKSNELLIDLGLSHGVSADLSRQWFIDIFNISPQVIKTPDAHYLSFDQITTRKLLHEIKPIVQDIPSLHEKLYRLSYAAAE